MARIARSRSASAILPSDWLITEMITHALLRPWAVDSTNVAAFDYRFRASACCAANVSWHSLPAPRSKDHQRKRLRGSFLPALDGARSDTLRSSLVNQAIHVWHDCMYEEDPSRR